MYPTHKVCSVMFLIHSLWCCTELEYILTKHKKSFPELSHFFHSSPESLWRRSWTSDQTLHAASSLSSKWSSRSQRGYTKTGHTKEAGVWHHQCANWYPVNQKDVQKQDPVDVSLDQTLFPQFSHLFPHFGIRWNALVGTKSGGFIVLIHQYAIHASVFVSKESSTSQQLWETVEPQDKSWPT